MDKIFDFETKEDGSYALYFQPPELLSNETKQHLVSSHKEFLMALRSMIDSIIEHTDKKEDEGGTKIEVV
ncbi:MAG: hypothetical protein EXR50_04135 [Dehalococcoidia bacterium]|nr:hypothetical protein [Dehalococcoidia bacterium]